MGFWTRLLYTPILEPREPPNWKDAVLYGAIFVGLIALAIWGLLREAKP